MGWMYLSDGYLASLAGWLVLLVAGFVCALRWRGRRRRVGHSLRLPQLSMSLLLLLLLLTLAEAWLAFFYDSTDSFNMTRVSQKWFDMHIAPHQQLWQFADGQTIAYRDDRPFEQPRETEHHLLFLGDSFTFGHGVADVDARFSNRVRRELDEMRPGRVRVSNLAAAGTDLEWVFALAGKLFEQQVRVDTLVYVMCLNDIEPYHPRHRKFYSDLAAHGPQSVLFRESFLLNLLYFRVKQFTLPEVSGYYSFVADDFAGAPWQKMSDRLRELDVLCRQNDCELQVVIFPFLHSLGPDDPFAAARKQVSDFCRGLDVPMLDLSETLAAHRDETLTVNPFDAHPNARAHELAADAIVRFEQEHLDAP